MDKEIAISILKGELLGTNEQLDEAVIMAVNAIQAEPTKHGRWMLYENQSQDDVNNGNYLFVCSNCNHSDIHARTVDVPYCWYCGARMDGGENG